MTEGFFKQLFSRLSRKVCRLLFSPVLLRKFRLSLSTGLPDLPVSEENTPFHDVCLFVCVFFSTCDIDKVEKSVDTNGKSAIKKNDNNKIKSNNNKKKNMPPPPHHVEMWRNVEGFHTSRTENITLKSPQDGLICAGT